MSVNAGTALSKSRAVVDRMLAVAIGRPTAADEYVDRQLDDYERLTPAAS